MKFLHTFASILLGLTLLFALSGCDLAFYRFYQFNERIHALRAYSVAGKVTDSSTPVRGATIAIGNKKPKPLRSSHFNAREIAATMEFTLAAPGYYPRAFKFTNEGLFEILPDTPSFPVQLCTPVDGDPLHMDVQLDKIEHPAHFRSFRASLRTSIEGHGIQRFVYFDIDRPDLHESLAPSGRTTTHSTDLTFPVNGMYISVPQDPSDPEQFTFSVPPDPRGYPKAYPTVIRLVSTSNDGGLQLIPFENGQFLKGRPRTAPDSGYAREISLTETQLRSLERSHYMPFYFKAGKLFGRGVITSMQVSADRVSLDVTLHIQPDGTPNVE